MGFIEHLEEFRQRIFKILGAFAIGFVSCFSFSDIFVNILLEPAKGSIQQLVFLKPTEAFIVHIKVSLIVGFLLVLPYIFYQVWQFVMPGLYAREKKLVIPLVFISVIFFIGGVSFAYFGVLRMGLRFLMGFATSMSGSEFGLKPMISVGSYITFATRIFLAFGLIFELPLVLIFLNQIGIVSVDMLKRKRPYAVVAIFIVAALITPPDVVTQLLLGVPLIALYEISIWSAVILNKIKGKNEEKQSEQLVQSEQESTQRPKIRSSETTVENSPDDHGDNL